MKILFWFSFIALCASTLCANVTEEEDAEIWSNYKRDHKKHFISEKVEKEHMAIFKSHLKKINSHNKLYKLGKTSFKRAVNKFTDISHERFASNLNGFISDMVEPNTADASYAGRMMYKRAIAPPSVDWRDWGVKTPVKDQGNCASCWSFAAAGAIEAHEKIYNSRKLDLSEQNLLDCAKSYMDLGCIGGHTLYAYNYTLKNKGLSLRMYYPYESFKDKCRYKKVFNAGTYSGAYRRLPKGDEEILKETVAFVGPVAAAMDGTLESLQDYAGGIYYDENCNSARVTHAVLIVGYGTENGQDYWLIKNSLGKYWGEGGYLRLVRNKNNHCGIATDTSYPIVETVPGHRF